MPCHEERHEHRLPPEPPNPPKSLARELIPDAVVPTKGPTVEPGDTGGAR